MFIKRKSYVEFGTRGKYSGDEYSPYFSGIICSECHHIDNFLKEKRERKKYFKKCALAQDLDVQILVAETKKREKK